MAHLFDPWLRSHLRLGGRLARICHAAMTIAGCLAEWRAWTSLPFDTSGTVHVEGALNPVHVWLENDYAVYVEPNVYGPPETLRMAEVEKPTPDANEVLVKVLAVSVNPADWHSMRGKPLFARATLGLLRPKHSILGGDVAGQVEAVGDGVTQFKPGDEVYANLLDNGNGGFAEYVSVPVDVMALKPASLSFEEAAAVPMAAVTALQGLRHHGEIEPGREGSRQWRVRRRRHLCRPDRQVLRGRGDRRDQHPEHRPRPVARRRSRRRLHDDRFRPERAALRPHPRHDREPIGVRSDTPLAEGGKVSVTGFTTVGGSWASRCAAARPWPWSRRT